MGQGPLLTFYLFIYLFMAVLGLRFCARAFSSCGEQGPLFIAVRGPLTIAASLVAEHRLQTRRLSSCGSRAQSLRGMWDLPRPGLEPVSPALAGRFSTTAPPGKPSTDFWIYIANKSAGLAKSWFRFVKSHFSLGFSIFLRQFPWLITGHHMPLKGQNLMELFPSSEVKKKS